MARNEVRLQRRHTGAVDLMYVGLEDETALDDLGENMMCLRNIGLVLVACSRSAPQKAHLVEMKHKIELADVLERAIQRLDEYLRYIGDD